MHSADDQVTLRVRLTGARWQELTRRARGRALELSRYAEMAFFYALHENLVSPKRDPAESDEAIYFELTVAARTRSRLARLSERHQSSIAAFSGSLLAQFLDRFATDPRDLRMMHYLASLLETRPVLSDLELRRGIELCEHNPAARLPSGYLARWIHTRVSSLLREVEKDGTPILVTPALIAEFLALSQGGGT